MSPPLLLWSGTWQQKTLSAWQRGFLTVHAIALDPYYIGSLEALGPLQQVEFDGLTLIERAIAILLNGGKMNKDIFAGGTLDKTVSLRPVEPLYCTFLSHKETPFASAKNISGVRRGVLRFESPRWGHRSRAE